MWYKRALNNDDFNIDESLQGINLSKKGVCMYAIETLAKSLLARMINDFSIVEGYVVFEQKSPSFQHTWIKLNNNQIIDPTLKQFTGWDISQVEYKEKTVYSPEDYLNICVKYPVNPEEYNL